MPPKMRTQQKAAASGGVCCICCQKFGLKDEVLFCSGSCQKHLHRYCASVSEQSYKTFISDDALQPFLCFCCFRAQKDDEVAKLRNIVDLLTEELNALKKTSPNEDWPLTPGADQSTRIVNQLLHLMSLQSVLHPTSTPLTQYPVYPITRRASIM